MVSYALWPDEARGCFSIAKTTGSFRCSSFTGGPFWAKKDVGAWSIPKGEFSDEPGIDAARRELLEETGFEVSGPFIPLSPITQKGGKWVFAWAVEVDADPTQLRSNSFKLGSREYPEVGRADWFTVEEGMRKINPAQSRFIAELEEKVG